ncbi:hypothetical protein F5Y12DRAFT_719485 [Xylaria sp. FL1777]|nr:hypothetical protein F5Y12DRAFT_719485 [Xylaria sp. FL1777]
MRKSDFFGSALSGDPLGATLSPVVSFTRALAHVPRHNGLWASAMHISDSVVYFPSWSAFGDLRYQDHPIWTREHCRLLHPGDRSQTDAQGGGHTVWGNVAWAQGPGQKPTYQPCGRLPPR